MKISLWSLLLSLVACVNSTLAQENEQKKPMSPSFTLGGQAMLSANDDSMFFNMGGGGIALTSKSTTVSVNFFPSLRYQFSTTRLTPVLGIGPQLYLRHRLIIGMPIYYTESKWNLSVGIGYKFMINHP